MEEEVKINDRKIRLIRGDITDLDVDAFVYYAQPNLVLGSGFGGAIASRGGAKIQEELKQCGTLSVGDAVVTSAGNLKARYIIHAVGPRFHEEETERKLRTTMENALRRAEEKGIQRLAVPAMGAGFFRVPLETCSRITLEVAREKIEDSGSLKEIIFCLRDSREYRAFLTELKRWR